MARPWSARCYGVARQRDGSRQNSTGSLRRAFPLSLGAWVPKNLARRSFGLLVSPARCCSTGSGRLDLDLLISGPRVNLVYQPYSREGADGQAVVCPLLRGSSPTRGVAPKQENKAIADQSPLLKLSLRRVRFQRTSTRQQLDCAKTL